VESQLKNIGLILWQQSDPDLPQTYFPSGYLPDAHDKDDNSTRKKMVHKMRGVLLCVLIFMLKDCNWESLSHKTGEEILGIYIHLFSVGILTGSWYIHETGASTSR